MTVSLVPLTAAVARAVLSGDSAVVTAGRGWPHADTYDALRPAVGDDGPGRFLVVVDGAVVGECGWYGPPGPDGEVEIGYGLAAPSRGRGAGTAAVRLLLDWVTARPGVTRVVADTEVGNAASRALLTRLGFEVAAVDGATVRYALAVTPT